MSKDRPFLIEGPSIPEVWWPDKGKHLLVRARSDKEESGYRKLCANPGCDYIEPKKVGNEEKGNDGE